MYLENLYEDKRLRAFQINCPSLWDTPNDRVDDRLPCQRVMAANSELDLVLSCISDYPHRHESKEGRTRYARSGLLAKKCFSARCAKELISGSLAATVWMTGVKRCVYLDQAISACVVYGCLGKQ